MKTTIPVSTATKVLLALLSIGAGAASGQQVYDSFEGEGVVCYAKTKTAKIDTLADNPQSDGVNGSSKCAKFVRSRQRYDYIKIFPQGKLGDVSTYASYDPNAPKLKLKVYTTAPVGTLVEIQLGKKSGIAYPEGTHSQYQARTTTTNAWEVLEFNYAVSPRGSKTSADEVDVATLLFNPNTSTSDTYYFDDLEGPAIEQVQQKSVKLWRKNK